MLELGSHLDLAVKFLEEVQTFFFFPANITRTLFFLGLFHGGGISSKNRIQ